MRVVAPATKASVLPASYHTGPIAAARTAGTSTWSLHDTHASPAASAARAAARISGPPTAASQGRARPGICCTAGRLTPTGTTPGSYARRRVQVKNGALVTARADSARRAEHARRAASDQRGVCAGRPGERACRARLGAPRAGLPGGARRRAGARARLHRLAAAGRLGVPRHLRGGRAVLDGLDARPLRLPALRLGRRRGGRSVRHGLDRPRGLEHAERPLLHGAVVGTAAPAPPARGPARDRRGHRARRLLPVDVPGASPRG